VGINFVKRTSIHLYIAILVAATNLAGNYLLVPEYGAMGACIATAVSYLLFFWARTLASMLVWRRLPVRNFVYVTVVVASMGVVPSLAAASIANTIVAVLLLITCLLYRSEIQTIYGLAANLAVGFLRR
jgi:O-antigen/teichoic acid export membrane protein